jgi:hypothetical protein
MEEDVMSETTMQQFFRQLAVYQKRARDRHPEYLDTHAADATFGERTLYEFLIDLSVRLERLEKVMEPAPEETDGKKKPRFY